LWMAKDENSCLLRNMQIDCWYILYDVIF
jgi:hypothetical protein